MNNNRPNKENPGSPRRISLRDIAAELGISHVTVSRALRNMQNVAPELKARIQAKAEEMGYVPDPLLSSLSRYSKTGADQPVQAELAWINTWDPPERLRQYKEFDLYWQGAFENAQRMGYHLEAFNLAELPAQRLQNILKARNIMGILLPPIGNLAAQLNTFDWSRFAVVRFGRTIPEPPAHVVTSSQPENAMLAFDRMRQLGYKRIGYVCEYSRARFSGSGFSWAQRELPADRQLPLLTLNPAHSQEQKQRELAEWMQQYRPDAILTDGSEVLHMLHKLGRRVPAEIGIATTSIHDTEIDAGIDQRPYEIGWAAVRMLTSLINENACGLPACQSELLIEGTWADGSMLPRCEA